MVPSTHGRGSAPVEEGSGKGRADAGGRWRRLRSSPSASTKLVAAPATKGSPTEDLTAIEPWHEVAQSVFGAGGAMGSVSDCQAKEAEQVVEEGDAGDTIKGNYQPPEPVAEAGQVVEEGDAGVSMEGVASIALLPTGAISGHFIRLPGSVCYGLHGTPISCERECSRGEDYRLIKLTIIDFKSKREKVLVVECRGHDAARLQNIDHLHGWEDDIVGLVEKEHGNQKVLLSFECETLKADKDAEDHITKYMPNLRGLDAVVNIGKMSISGINLDEDDEPSGDN